MNQRIERTLRWVLDARPTEVFPLLCPIREREWIDGWTADVVHSVSGVAEEGAVFTTTAPGGRRDVWMVARYEPPWRVDYDIVSAVHARRLSLTVTEERPGMTAVHVRLTLTALDDAVGELEAWADARARSLAALEQPLRHYLRTGQLLRR